MKTQPPEDERWKELVSRAQRDTPPPTDLASLLRAANAVTLPNHRETEPPSWLDDFATLFAFRRAVSFCLCGTGALTALACWQAWDCWRAVAWAEWLVVSRGGSL